MQIEVTPEEYRQLEVMAGLHDLSLPAYVSTIIAREARVITTLYDRHPHLFTAAPEA